MKFWEEDFRDKVPFSLHTVNMHCLGVFFFFFLIGRSGFIRESQDYRGLKSWHWGSSCQRWAQLWQSTGCTKYTSWPGPIFFFFSHLSTLGVWPPTFPAQSREPWTLPPSMRPTTSRVLRASTPHWPRVTSSSRGVPARSRTWSSGGSNALQRGYMSLDLGDHLLAGHLESV